MFRGQKLELLIFVVFLNGIYVVGVILLLW